jgi:hypothetical protein
MMGKLQAMWLGVLKVHTCSTAWQTAAQHSQRHATDSAVCVFAGIAHVVLKHCVPDKEQPVWQLRMPTGRKE